MVTKIYKILLKITPRTINLRMRTTTLDKFIRIMMKMEIKIMDLFLMGSVSMNFVKIKTTTTNSKTSVPKRLTIKMMTSIRKTLISISSQVNSVRKEGPKASKKMVITFNIARNLREVI